MRAGYIDCGCRDCFDTAIGLPGDLCALCEEAGCFGEDAHCQREDAYGGEECDDSDRTEGQDYNYIVREGLKGI